MPGKGDRDDSQGAEIGLQREPNQRSSPQLTAALFPAPLRLSKSPELMTPARSAAMNMLFKFPAGTYGSEQDAWEYIYGSVSIGV